MKNIRQNLTLLLMGLLPFHALLVTVFTKVIAGAGNSPLTMLAFWKEGVLAVILGVAFLELCRLKMKNARLKIDAIDVLIVSLIILGVIVSYLSSSIFNLSFLYGLKYDFIPLIVFLLLRRVPWSDVFVRQVQTVLIAVGSIVCVYGFISLILPQSFFSMLGYSDLHSLYNPSGALAPFQQIGGTTLRRMQSTMSGPNQLGLWLLIPLSLVLVRDFKFQISNFKFIIGIFLFGIFLTFSRSAWIAAAIMIIFALWHTLPRKKFWKTVTAISTVGLLCIIALSIAAPSVIQRSASTADHLKKPLEAISFIIKNPLGLGLGSAGPASNRVSDTCVHLPEASDASWATVHPHLCVFVGNDQIQPIGKACNCPLIPENWYLQIGVEMGVIGFVLYIALVGLVLIKLYKFKIKNLKFINHFPVFYSFLGISIAALFLHAWEDSAVAYSVWILIAVAYAKMELSQPSSD